MNSIKVAVVGTGFMGWVHIEALRRLGIGIAGVLGSSPEKTKAFALKTGIAKAYVSYEEVLADSNAGSVHLGVGQYSDAPKQPKQPKQQRSQ